MWTVLWIGVILADGFCYSLAKRPDREQMRFWWIMPGSGFYLLARYGRERR